MSPSPSPQDRPGRLASFWLAARPKTLTAALVPVTAGLALAYAEASPGQPLRAWTAGLALLASLFIQIGTNLFNDALDFEKGADTAERIGPVRVTQSGLLSPRAVLLLGAASFALAAIVAIPLMLVGGWPIVAIGVVSLICGYAYTGGPLPLAYVGLGDVFVMVFFGLVAVAGTTYLVSDAWSPIALLAGAQVGAHATVLLAVNNLRDIAGDRKANKRTLAVRFGEAFGKAQIALLALLPFALGLGWIVAGGAPGGAASLAPALLPLLALPLALRLIAAVRRTPPSPKYNAFLAEAARLHLVFGLLLSAGLALPRLLG